ncbi:unnamed protein product [Plutella xylostella]|uniref:(diamondback moth) hypothetical protein n=1 Tax=Plutella xylostella TaxID=51655 RepID=A0A8S4EYD4_PLUXY|nr:unnamed protein product [Plutella xylostella]
MEKTEDEGLDDQTDLTVSKFSMLEYEKQIFIDVFEKDALLIMAKEKAYLEGGVHFVSTRILVVDLLKNRVPIAHITGIIVLRAHTILESCQEAFALRLYRQNNKTGFIKAFSNSPISFTFGYHQVEKVMRALFVTELFLWPRFHGVIIKCLSRRQAEVEELHLPMSGNTTHIQTCLLDIMNYTVKQLKSMNRTLDLQEITTENCITKKFHKVLQSQLDCVWHQLSTRTKEYIQDLKILRAMIIESAACECDRESAACECDRDSTIQLDLKILRAMIM